MPHLCGRAGFSQETQPRRFIADIFFADDFQRHRKAQIDIEAFVSDAHGAAAQLDRLAIPVKHHLIVLKQAHDRPRLCLCGVAL
jgi:hypothetical protein